MLCGGSLTFKRLFTLTSQNGSLKNHPLKGSSVTPLQRNLFGNFFLDAKELMYLNCNSLTHSLTHSLEFSKLEIPHKGPLALKCLLMPHKSIAFHHDTI